MISVIFCSISDEKTRFTEKHYRALLGNETHEIIAIRDARSLAEAYNRGIDRAKGDILVFSHDDIEFLDPASWLVRIKKHLTTFDFIGLAGTSRLVAPAWASAGPPYTFGQVAELDGDSGELFRVLLCSAPISAVPDIQAADGLFFAVKRQVVERIRFDDATFDGFHCYDIDFSYRTYMANFKLAVVTDIPVLHASQGKFDERWQAFAERFIAKHSSSLAPAPQRPFQHALVGARNREELLEIMMPAHLQTAVAVPSASEKKTWRQKIGL